MEERIMGLSKTFDMFNSTLKPWSFIKASFIKLQGLSVELNISFYDNRDVSTHVASQGHQALSRSLLGSW